MLMLTGFGLIATPSLIKKQKEVLKTITASLPKSEYAQTNHFNHKSPARNGDSLPVQQAKSRIIG